MKGSHVRAGLMAGALGLASQIALAGVPANDNCSTPTQITGTGFFTFDLTGATTGQEGQGNFGCSPTGDATFADDVWYCWTASCSGLVHIATCGLTNIDTKIALYAGCGCPVTPSNPLCCNDDACQKQSGITCEVVCGQQYMIQIGHAVGTPPGTGEFRIECEGNPCPPPPPKSQGDCCHGKPSFLNALSPDFTEVVAVATEDRSCLTDYVVHVIDMKNQASAPVNSNWIATPWFNDATNCPVGPPVHATWTKGHLGTVFGVALDNAGNIYVAHTSVYGVNGNPIPDTLGVGGAGAVYKIDTNTAVASVFNLTPLPNNPDPNISPASESYPGLGNLSFDCDTQMLYVSNHEDGRIYRLDSLGNVLSTFDHATATIAAGGAAELGDAPGFVPRNERVWAVQPHNGRLYYSTWDAGPQPIFSVGLDGFGEFIAGSNQQEVMSAGGFGGFHNPVADITFSPSGCLIAAERTMSDDTTSGAHQSRVLEFCFNAGSGQWDPSGSNFDVGGIFTFENATGGADFDTFNNRVFVTSDAIQFGPQLIYGLQGLPAAGGNVNNSVLIDLDQDTSQIDKYQLGSVEVSCLGKCAEITDESILCEIGADGPTGCYKYTYTLTNNSGQTVQYVLLPNANISPNVITLNPPLLDGQSTTISVLICDVKPGEQFCFDMILADAKVNECCTIEHCVEIPDCECLQVLQSEVICGSAANTFTFNFTLQNLTNDVVEHMFVFPPLPPDPNSNMTITPQYTDVPTTPPFATTGPHNVTLTFPVAPAPGSQVCIRISLHNASMGECCSKVVCITIPDCPQKLTCPPDVVPNGVVDVDDLLMMINKWGMDDTYCDIAPQPTGDGTVNVDDLLMVINGWGPCP
jgi:hypothetical protein